jgi:hypothetical protein
MVEQVPFILILDNGVMSGTTDDRCKNGPFEYKVLVRDIGTGLNCIPTHIPLYLMPHSIPSTVGQKVKVKSATLI